ncbi:MAG: hypothetical protein ACYTXE_32075 [Nostoc sp.]
MIQPIASSSKERSVLHKSKCLVLNSLVASISQKSIFCWSEKTPDKDFPNRFQVVLAKWSIEDFDLWEWHCWFWWKCQSYRPTNN